MNSVVTCRLALDTASDNYILTVGNKRVKVDGALVWEGKARVIEGKELTRKERLIAEALMSTMSNHRIPSWWQFWL